VWRVEWSFEWRRAKVRQQTRRSAERNESGMLARGAHDWPTLSSHLFKFHLKPSPATIFGQQYLYITEHRFQDASLCWIYHRRVWQIEAEHLFINFQYLHKRLSWTTKKLVDITVAHIVTFDIFVGQTFVDLKLVMCSLSSYHSSFVLPVLPLQVDGSSEVLAGIDSLVTKLLLDSQNLVKLCETLRSCRGTRLDLSSSETNYKMSVWIGDGITLNCKKLGRKYETIFSSLEFE